jgi:hypothetical protein
VTDAESARLAHFVDLDAQEQAQAIRKLAVDGWGPWTISSATGLCVESVLLVLRPAGEERAP